MSTGTGYAFHQVIDGGGSAIATNSDPSSSAPPPELRVASIPAVPPHAANSFAFHLLDGTSIALLPWIFEESTQAWVKALASAVTVTTSPQVQALAHALPQGSRIFMQVTANAGTTKKVGWHLG